MDIHGHANIFNTDDTILELIDYPTILKDFHVPDYGSIWHNNKLKYVKLRRLFGDGL